MHRRTQLRIDISALEHNLHLLKKWNGNHFFCPMVKANAYGHGAVLVAKTIEQMGLPTMGVALIEEGVELRQNGITKQILTFAPFNEEGADAILKSKLTPVITRLDDLLALEAVHGRQDVHVHLKFNTGMQRLGFDQEELPLLTAELKNKPWIKVEGVCTHLSHGEDADMANGPTATQLKTFERMAEGFPGVRHAHKSASLATLKDKTQLGARPGIGVYGLPHHGREVGEGLRPVLTWNTEVVTVHTVEKGEAVSYSSRWVAKRKSTIGVVPMGYGDGYMRILSNKGVMLCRGARVPVVGSVCMDYILLDLTDIESEGTVQPGEPVVVLGRQGQAEISAAELGELAGTIAYEIVTNISKRVTRRTV
jgi:alanine racemase